MDGNNWRTAAQGEPNPNTDANNGRTQLSPDSRQRIVCKIMDTLKKHLPISGPEGLTELKKIAVRFEEKIYTAATSQTDYLRKISYKMLTMESKSQATSTGGNSMPTNSTGANQALPDPASHTMQSQVRNQVQQQLPISMPNQSQPRQQILSQNLQNSIPSAAVQNSASLPPAMPSMNGLTQTPMSNVVGQNSNLPPSMSGLPQNSVSSSMVGQGIPSNVFANSQRQQLQGRQQVLPQQQSQSPQQQYNIYQQQQILKQKLQQGNVQPSFLQSHLQQQQQQLPLLQPNQMQGSQQSLIQMSSALQSGQANLPQTQSSLAQSVEQSGLQQNQHSALAIQQHQQSILRQQQQTPQSSVHQQQQQQQQMMGQQPSGASIQQNQLLGHPQNSGTDMQQQQQQRLLLQHQQQQQQQQQVLGQQNHISNLHQQQQLSQQSNVFGLQQQPMGPQSSVSNMHQHQHSMHMLPQAKVVAAQQQQQNQQTSSSLLSSQSPQTQSQSQQQQLMSQLPQQPTQLQQQQQPISLQREMQQRIQISSASLQPPNSIEQQKQQLFQSQRGILDAPTTSIDSLAQTGNNTVDWQEETFQKIKSMRDIYYRELSELHLRLSQKYQQADALMQGSKALDQIEKFKVYKGVVERMLQFLNISSKANVPLACKDRLGSYEKQILTLLNSNRGNKRTASSQQQGQPQLSQSSGQSHPSMLQQPPPQIPQLQQNDSHMNQVQAVNLPASVTSGMQHGGSTTSSTLFGASQTQPNMMSSMQSAANVDSAQGNTLSSLPQGIMGSLQQNIVSVSQQTNMALLSQGGNALQSNMNNLPQTASMLQQQQHMRQEQHLQQQPQQQMMQNQQLKQQYQQRHMHPQLIQQQKQQHLLQQQQQFHQQQQQKQQMPQLHQMNNEVNDLKVRQGGGVIKPMFQQHHQSGPRPTYHQQLQMSPQILQSQSPQISQLSSPQIDQQSLLTSHPKTGTPLQSANSPFVVPSPSTPLLAPSPIPGDQDKQVSGVSSISNPGNIGLQQMGLVVPAITQTQSIAIGTPGISASPLLAEFTSADGIQGTDASVFSGKSSAAERPLERLIKVVRSMSSKAFSSSVSDIGSVVSMVDGIAGSAPVNGSRAAVGEDLVAMTKCRLQARNLIPPDGSAAGATKKMRRHTSAMPLNAVSSAGSVNNYSFKKLNSLETSDLESTATSRIKRQKVEANHVLLEEIREINQRLIDTVVEISEEDVDSISAAAKGEGAVVKCSFTAIALCPNLKSQFVSSQMSPIWPLRLLVPANYPSCSPALLDKLPVESSKEMEDLSVKAKSMFSTSLRALSQPMSLGEMARTWDACVRKVITEYAQQSGGGSFSSSYGTWDNCVSV